MGMKAGRPNSSLWDTERGSPVSTLSHSHQEPRETLLKQKLMETVRLEHEIDMFRKTSSEAVVASVKVCHLCAEQIYSSPLQPYDLT